MMFTPIAPWNLPYNYNLFAGFFRNTGVLFIIIQLVTIQNKNNTNIACYSGKQNPTARIRPP
ncbi:MAG: hypothetical protein A2X33_08080 [Elusimicrobia bacterium GWA2_51_34]|nr:MAG: hypothetical protein A2X33_08080 [Elusimicrobia bacterium GWA2_51_34]